MMRANKKLPWENIILVASLLAATIWVVESWWRWAHFEYRTFDLAFYVQALHGFSEGKNWSSLLGVRPFGNHADFIILLIWPIYAIVRHPMVLVVAQNVALAASLPLAWRIARRFGWSERNACLLALIFLANPILSYVARHEFHPEAFAAPLFLAIYDTWQRKKLGWYWIWIVIFLSCKENLGLLLLTWFGVKAFYHNTEHSFWRWFGLPALFTMLWMAVYLLWLGPKWNQGNVDFGGLYSHFREQGLLDGAAWVLGQSLRGNLLWTLLLPTLLIPLRRPLSLLPAAPILLQHLLSWRSSEWTVYFHYGAPLLPIFWVATLESFPNVSFAWRNRLAAILLGINVVFFLMMGTPAAYWSAFEEPDPSMAIKKEALARIPARASVLSTLSLQSHLAQRDGLYSLHLVMKGLKTLSRQSYLPPPPTDVVIVDYADAATFDRFSGYYHSTMRSDSTIIPSSDELFHRFLAKASWSSWSKGSVTVLTRSPPIPPVKTALGQPLLVGVVDPGTDLLSIMSSQDGNSCKIVSNWSFRQERIRFVWLTVTAIHTRTGERRSYLRGLCCPEASDIGVSHPDLWDLGEKLPGQLSDWQLTAVFEDFAARGRSSCPALVVANVPWAK